MLRRSILFIITYLVISLSCAYGQVFNYLPDQYSRTLTSQQIASNTQNISSGYADTVSVINYDDWQNLQANPNSTAYTFKSVQDYVRVGVNHDVLSNVAAYHYTLVLQLTVYQNNANYTTQNVNIEVEYNPDSLHRYKDLSVYKFSGYQRFYVKVLDILDNNNSMASVVRSNVRNNFVIEPQIEVQRYDKKVFYLAPECTPMNNNKELVVDWWLSDVPYTCTTNYSNQVYIKPIEYELEWLYVDNYHFNPYVTSPAITYSFPNDEIKYNFHNNATRIRLAENHFSIPLIYEHGAIVFRVRAVRPNYTTNYKDVIYSAWNIPDNGTISTTDICLDEKAYLINTAHTSDSLNWQYSINFAEQGKYKHVINYFDGSLKNRQTQTKINSDNDYVIIADKAYDHEGRPAIQTLPTPVQQVDLGYRKGLLIDSVSGNPMTANDFDNGSCSLPTALHPLANSSLDKKYYSPLNPDMSGMQQFLPDAKGYPFIQSIYSPDNTNKLLWQGGAGKDMQLWNGHGTQYEYTRVMQPEIDRLLGTEAGKYAFYPKQVITDGNGQSSITILDPSGKTVATALSGDIDTVGHPISNLSNYVAGDSICSDLLQNMDQDVQKDRLVANTSFYNDNTAGNRIRYSVSLPPYPICDSFLQVKAKYDVSITTDCGTAPVYELTDSAGGFISKATNVKVYGNSGTQTIPGLQKGKYLINKELSVSEHDIKEQVGKAIVANAPNCYKNEDYFIRKGVEAQTFPCTSDDESDCSKKKKEMLAELYPNAKYGVYSVTNGTIVGSSNSIFTYTPAVVTQVGIPLPTNISPSHGLFAAETGINPYSTVDDNYRCAYNLTDPDVNSHFLGPLEPAQNYYPYSPNDLAYISSSLWTTDNFIYVTDLPNLNLNRPIWYKTNVFISDPSLLTAGFKVNWRTIPGCGYISKIALNGDSTLYTSMGCTVPWNNGVATQCYSGDFTFNSYIPGNLHLGWNQVAIQVSYGNCDATNQNSGQYNGYSSGSGGGYGYDMQVPYVNFSFSSNCSNCGINLPQTIATPSTYRYKSSCIGTFPYPVRVGNQTYTSFANVTPEMLAANFTDSIAEMLLPLHPEYCKLQACDGTGFRQKLGDIQTFQEAHSATMDQLEYLIYQDPLYLSNPTQGMHDQLATLANNPLSKNIQQMALEGAYCGGGNQEEQMHCALNVYASEISAGVTGLSNDNIKQKYFDLLKAYYLANRDLIAQKTSDATASCNPCSADRMTLSGTSIFPPTVFTAGGDLDPVATGFPSWYTDLYNTAQHNPSSLSATIPQSVLDSIAQSKDDEAQAQADDVAKNFTNCVSRDDMTTYNAKMTALTTAVKNLILSGTSLTPDKMKDILTNPTYNVNVSLTDLCHPFLVAYGLFDGSTDRDYDFDCADPDVYTGMVSFFSNTNVINALKAATTSSSSSITLGSDVFSAKIQSLYSSYPNAFTIQKTDASVSFYLFNNTSQQTYYNYSDLSVIPTGSSLTTAQQLHYYVKGRSSTSALLEGASSIVINKFICLNNDTKAMGYGAIAGKTALMLAYVNGSSSLDSYYVWSNKIDIMQPLGNTSMKSCVTCVDIYNAMLDFQNEQANYGYNKAINHPFAEKTIANYLSYKLNKAFSFNEYYDLMKGCALSDKLFIENITGSVLGYFSDTTSANNFVDNLNAPQLVLYRVAHGIPSNSYVQNPYVMVYVNMNNIPKDSLLWYKNYIINKSSAAGAWFTDYNYGGPTVVLSNNVNLAVAWVGTEPIKFYEDGGYRDYAAVTDPNSWVSALTKSDLIAFFSSYCTPSTGAFYISGNRLLRPDDYSNSLRQNYLNYVYGMSSSTHSAVVDAISPANLAANVSGFAGNTITYDDPYCTGTKTDLYVYQQPASTFPGYVQLQTILSSAQASNAGKIFPAGNPPIAISGFKIIKKADGVYWYRYFNAPNSNKMYNVYITPPAWLADPEDYTFNSFSIGQGDDSVYTFTATMSYNGNTITCTGHTDFPIGYCQKLSNTVLMKRDNIVCYDSLDCEHDELMVGVMNGKTAYYLYFDSLRDDLSGRMLNYVISNAKDTLRLCAQDQKYQYTLYYYDRAGNLAKTVPPAGVNVLTGTAIAQVDVDRNNGSSTPGTSHTKQSEYRYNSQNKLIYSKTPDGGETYYFYDAASRLVFSQNTRQRLIGHYSYLLYDDQSRPVETGDIKLGCEKDYSATIFSTGYCSNLTTDPAHPNYVTNIPDMATLTGYIRAYIGRTDVVLTMYDNAAPDLATVSNSQVASQENLRKRVSAIYYWKTLSANATDVAFALSLGNPYFATYYSYDVNGNVKTAVYNFKTLASHYQRYKRVDYDYDLLSGKLNMISYNRNMADQFYQKYDYDADNRITLVQTSNDGIIWDKDAQYSYYKHGPLAQAKIGDAHIQSMEYAYTIQGWLKAINGELRRPDKDMGHNGQSNDQAYARDIVTHALDYFAGDYASIGSGATTAPAGMVSLHNFSDPAKNLYNGNIVRQTTSIGGLSHDSSMQRTYQYDQLQRLVTARNTWVNESTPAVLTPSQIYQSNYSYDRDGNIQTLARRDKTTAQIDNFTYHYAAGNLANQLTSVSDAVTTNAATGNDLKSGQPADNYQYDREGNLLYDKQGHIKMAWNYTGKLTNVNDTVTGQKIYFSYDGKGNRIYKEIVKKISASQEYHKGEYYVRDASGNILAVYNTKGTYNLLAALTAQVPDILIAIGTTGFTDVITDQIAPQPSFPTIFLGHTLTDVPDWGETQVSAKSAGFYLASDKTAMHNMLMGSTKEYLPDLLAYEQSQGTDMIPSALSISPDRATVYDISTPILSLGDDNAEHRYLNYFQQFLDGSKLWGNLGLSYDKTNYDANSQVLTQQIADDPKMANNIGAKMQELIAGNVFSGGADVRQLYRVALTDADITGSANLLNIGTNDFSNVVAQALNDNVSYVGTDLVTYFDQWPQATYELRRNNTTLQLLGDVYAGDKRTVLGDFIANRPTTTLISSIADLPGFTVTDWKVAVDNGGGPSFDPTPPTQPSYPCTFRDTMNLAEHHLYGSSRLGIKTYDSLEIAHIAGDCEAPSSVTSLINPATWQSADYGDLVNKTAVSPYGNWSQETYTVSRTVGKKFYELTDHLGNVLATVLDRKTGSGGSVGSLYDHWHADVASATDYYPGGMMMPGRSTQYSWSRMGMQRQEKEDDIYGAGITYAFKYRMDNVLINRFFSPDPLHKKYPWNSDYAFSENRLIDGIEFEGLEFVAAQAAKHHSIAENVIKVQQSLSKPAPSGMSKDIKTEGSLDQGGAGGQYSSEYANFTGNYNVKAITGSATLKMPKSTLAIDAEVKGAVGSASLDGGITTSDDQYGIGAAAQGSLLAVEANLSTPGSRPGSFAQIGAGAYAAKGEVTGTLTILGMKVSSTIGGSVGADAGGSLGIYVDENGVNIEGTEHLGLILGEKLGMKITLPFSQ